MGKNLEAVALAKKRWAKKSKKEKAAHASKMAKARWDKLKDQSN
jgi:hypothetical protein